MLTALRAVISVINAVLHLVAVAFLAGGTVLIGLAVLLVVVFAVLALSGAGLFGISRRNRPKPPG